MKKSDLLKLALMGLSSAAVISTPVDAQSTRYDDRSYDQSDSTLSGTQFSTGYDSSLDNPPIQPVNPQMQPVNPQMQPVNPQMRPVQPGPYYNNQRNGQQPQPSSSSCGGKKY